MIAYNGTTINVRLNLYFSAFLQEDSGKYVARTSGSLLPMMAVGVIVCFLIHNIIYGLHIDRKLRGTL